MNEIVLNQEEEEDKKTGFILSLAIHILLFLLLLIPCLSYMDPPPDLEGVMVVFGDQSAGEVQAEEVKSAAASAPKQTETKSSSSSNAQSKASKSKPKAIPVQSKTVEETAEVAAVQKKVISVPTPTTTAPVKTAEEIQQEKLELEEQKRKEEMEELRKAKEAEKARKEAEEAAKKQKYESAKSKFGDMFNKSNESSTGPNEGQNGDPLGKPNADALEGISTGSGRVGGGLSNRGVMFEPNFKDNSQKTGVVVVKICVNNKGHVISSKFTQKGSTTTDNYLVALAEKEVKKYKFSPTEIDEQCGTITVDFKLK